MSNDPHETPELLIKRLWSEIVAKDDGIRHLMEQVAACKVYISALELELAAKKREVRSREGTVTHVRGELRRMVSVANQQSERLRAAGLDTIDVGTGASAVVASTPQDEARDGNVVPLRVVE